MYIFGIAMCLLSHICILQYLYLLKDYVFKNGSLWLLLIWDVWKVNTDLLCPNGKKSRQFKTSAGHASTICILFLLGHLQVFIGSKRW